MIVCFLASSMAIESIFTRVAKNLLMEWLLKPVDVEICKSYFACFKVCTFRCLKALFADANEARLLEQKHASHKTQKLEHKCF